MRLNTRANAHRGRLVTESTPANRRVASGRPAFRTNRLRPALVQLENRQLLATFQVTSPADTFNSNGTPTTGTLRWAVDQADNASTPSTITFNLPPLATIAISKGADPFVLTNKAEPTTITGPGASELTVSADQQLGGGVFQIAANVTASISGLTISKGFSYYASVDDLGSLTLTGCTVSDNTGVGNVEEGARPRPAAGSTSRARRPCPTARSAIITATDCTTPALPPSVIVRSAGITHLGWEGELAATVPRP